MLAGDILASSVQYVRSEQSNIECPKLSAHSWIHRGFHPTDLIMLQYLKLQTWSSSPLTHLLPCDKLVLPPPLPSLSYISISRKVYWFELASVHLLLPPITSVQQPRHVPQSLPKDKKHGIIILILRLNGDISASLKNETPAPYVPCSPMIRFDFW
jgi:hypothetical protein